MQPRPLGARLGCHFHHWSSPRRRYTGVNGQKGLAKSVSANTSGLLPENEYRILVLIEGVTSSAKSYLG